MLEQSITTCKHLSLMPLPEESSEVHTYFQECVDNDNTLEEREQYFMKLIGTREYAPYCSKSNCPCIVLESPVMSMQAHGLERLYQPFYMTLINASRIIECPERELPDIHIEGEELVDFFILKHLKLC